MDLTNYLETFHRIQHSVKMYNEAFLQAVLSLELHGNVAIWVQHLQPLQDNTTKMENQMESSFTTYLWKMKTVFFFLATYRLLYI